MDRHSRCDQTAAQCESDNAKGPRRTRVQKEERERGTRTSAIVRHHDCDAHLSRRHRTSRSPRSPPEETSSARLCAKSASCGPSSPSRPMHCSLFFTGGCLARPSFELGPVAGVGTPVSRPRLRARADGASFGKLRWPSIRGALLPERP